MHGNLLGKKIKTARVLVGLSQKELAEKLNLSEKTISAYEKGRATPPSPTLQRIANATNQYLQFFSENEGKDKTDEILEKLDIIIQELKRINNG
ncbi:MAG TPA: helix-turn-helix transcriptional regulator [Patescibacteria group bacterium]|nr:helix-turn-helix transcriptional regulator [Patescibacteria group bacterium]